MVGDPVSKRDFAPISRNVAFVKAILIWQRWRPPLNLLDNIVDYFFEQQRLCHSAGQIVNPASQFPDLVGVLFRKSLLARLAKLWFPVRHLLPLGEP